MTHKIIPNCCLISGLIVGGDGKGNQLSVECFYLLLSSLIKRLFKEDARGLNTNFTIHLQWRNFFLLFVFIFNHYSFVFFVCFFSRGLLFCFCFFIMLYLFFSFCFGFGFLFCYFILLFFSLFVLFCFCLLFDLVLVFVYFILF